MHAHIFCISIDILPYQCYPCKSYSGKIQQGGTTYYYKNRLLKWQVFSRGTVDRVLNNRGSVNANTAARVREIAEKLNYKPNKAGLMLAAQKKNLKIGVILFPDSNPFSVKSLKA